MPAKVPSQTERSPERRFWTGPMVWDGRELDGRQDWVVQLNAREVEEIRSGVDVGKSSTRSLSELTRSDFPLPRLGPRLLQLRDEVLEGRGFAVVRGLPANEWDDEDLIRACWGIGNWMGDPVPQNADAHLLGHVIDQKLDPSPNVRLYQTNQALSFHSDSCDIVGLLCLRAAKHGGASSLASAAAIHNELCVRDTAALESLYGEYDCDRFGEIPVGKRPYYTVRIFNEIDDKFVCCAMDPDIRSAQRLAQVAPLSQEKVRALDAFQQTAKSLALNMNLQRGDIQFVNNLTVVHSREPFEDYAQLNRRRYLARLWLSSPLGRSLPAFFTERWGTIEAGALRGGIRVAGATPVTHLKPDG